ncbi:MAG: Maf family protein, partial [Nannocystaceae bacterium]|nr:Maf family protein [Nannocystaceae bacterium]
LAAAKAQAAAHEPDAIVLAADTVVWCEADAPLGKPRDRDDARAMLRRLAAREHHVTTAWALAGAVPLELHESTTSVWLRAIADDELEAYLDADEWRDKAGGYGIQGRAAAFIPRIVGSHAAVIGLPLCEVVARLHALGVRAQ